MNTKKTRNSAAKAALHNEPFTARLKSCPDTFRSWKDQTAHPKTKWHWASTPAHSAERCVRDVRTESPGKPGRYTGLACALLLAFLLFPVFVQAGQSSPVELDRYGGCRGLKVPGGATGYFRLARVGPRWIFATPEGNAFWLRSVYSISTFDGGEMLERSLQRKYNTGSIPWEPYMQQAVRRLREWGFNTIGEHSSHYAWPVPAYTNKGNLEQMPFIRLIRPSRYTVAGGQVKNIIAGLDSRTYTGWRGGPFPDVFAPAFATLSQALARDTIERMLAAPLTNSPWLVGTTLDDADELYGFGAEPDASPDHYHSHLGWMAAATAPNQFTNPEDHKAYPDTRVYTKYAFRDFLREKYHTLPELNAAWRARYTTWDSDGGWPYGKGVLDESGRNPWLGRDFDRLSDTVPQVRKDLDEFLERIADRYFATVADAVRAYTPHHLVFGPASIAAGARPEVLRAAARHLDAIQVSAPPNRPDLLQRAYAITGKPLFVWITFMSQADSPLADTPGWKGGYDLPTQEVRGQAYAGYLRGLLSFRSPTDGAYPMLGLDFWAWTDKVVWGERNNFGLTSYHDNAYDGKEDVRNFSRDAAGNAVGGEIRDHGNFLGTVTEANQSVCSVLRQEWKAAPVSPAARKASKK